MCYNFKPRHPRTSKSWLISQTKPVQIHSVLWGKKLKICLHLSHHKENQQIKRTLTYRCANFRNSRSINSFRMWCCFTGWTFWLLKMKPLHCLEMSGTKYPMTQYHIPDELLPHPHHRKKPQNSHNCDVCGCLKMHLNSIN